MKDLPILAEEYTGHLKAAREALAELDIDCAVLMGQELQYWLTGYDTLLGAVLPQALILTPGQEAAGFVWQRTVPSHPLPLAVYKREPD